jgi:hypothetical protein
MYLLGRLLHIGNIVRILGVMRWRKREIHCALSLILAVYIQSVLVK